MGTMVQAEVTHTKEVYASVNGEEVSDADIAAAPLCKTDDACDSLVTFPPETATTPAAPSPAPTPAAPSPAPTPEAPSPAPTPASVTPPLQTAVPMTSVPSSPEKTSPPPPMMTTASSRKEARRYGQHMMRRRMVQTLI